MFDTLNEEQKAVVDFDGGPLRVVAGAGTGKTTALTARVAGLVERGTRADRVLLLTFTRRAARQMMRRARARAREDGSHRLVGGTFHSVAHHTLRRHAAQLALPEGFSVIDAADAADVFDLVRGWAPTLRGGALAFVKVRSSQTYKEGVGGSSPSAPTTPGPPDPPASSAAR